MLAGITADGQVKGHPRLRPRYLTILHRPGPASGVHSHAMCTYVLQNQFSASGFCRLWRWHLLEPLTWARIYYRLKNRSCHKNSEKEACGNYWWVMTWEGGKQIWKRYWFQGKRKKKNFCKERTRQLWAVTGTRGRVDREEGDHSKRESKWRPEISVVKVSKRSQSFKRGRQAIKADQKGHRRPQVGYDQVRNTLQQGEVWLVCFKKGKMIHTSGSEQLPYGFDKLRLNKMWLWAWFINHSVTQLILHPKSQSLQ